MRLSAGTARSLALCSTIALAGCFSLGRPAPPVEQYVLGGGGALATVAGTRDSGAITIGLRRLDLAAYLATRFIVVRRGTSQIITSDFRRWGEDLGDGINRVLGAHLAAAAPIGRVDVAPWPVRSRHDYLVEVHVARFEGVADSAATDGGVHLRAAWEIIRPMDGAVVARGSTDYREGGWTVGDFAALVARLDTALGRVAGDIRVCLDRLMTATARPGSCAA